MANGFGRVVDGYGDSSFQRSSKRPCLVWEAVYEHVCIILINRSAR